MTCRRLLMSAFIAALLHGSCSDDDEPLSSKEQNLEGTWRLELADVDADEFEFSYSFRRGGTFSNRMGGSFLERLQELNEIEGIEIDTGQLDVIEGGFVDMRGTWSVVGDSLEISFSSLEVEVFGNVPIVGRITVPVHQQDLPPGSENRLNFTCSIDGDRLRLKGESLTLGVGLGEAGAEAGLDSLATEALGLVNEFAQEQIRTSGRDEVLFLRTE